MIVVVDSRHEELSLNKAMNLRSDWEGLLSKYLLAIS